MRSIDGGNTWQASPTQGPVANAPLFAGGPGTAAVEVSDATVGVEYAISAVAPPGGQWTGAAAYVFTDVALALVTVAPGRTLVANGVNYTGGQQVTIDRTDADQAAKGGFIQSNY